MNSVFIGERPGRAPGPQAKGKRLALRTDEQLVQAARRGEAEAWLALGERYYPLLVAVARAVLGDHHLAEDAAQEALARACRALATLQQPAGFGAWVLTIARRQAIDLQRRRKTLQPLDAGALAAPAGEPVSEQVLAVRRWLAELPAETRELVLLRYERQLSYQAIAELLGLSTEAINGRLRRVKDTLRRHLETMTERIEG